MRSYRMGAMCLAAAFFATVLIGCSENNGKKPKIHRVEGIAKLIDLQNNVVSMTVKDDKGVERELAGTVREDTEVLINGRSQTLKDVCVGDQVVVYGYKEAQGDNQKLIAQKVEVTRSRESDWKRTGTGDPAKQPVVKDSEPPKATATTPPPGPATPLPPKTTEQPADPSKPAAGPNREEAAAQLTDMIYAQIRIRMEEAIAKRTELLNAGKPRSDADVRKQEEIIMNARTRLIEAGEVVPEITPPIVELAAPTTPPATPPGAKPPAPPSDKPASPPAAPPAPTPPPSKP